MYNLEFSKREFINTLKKIHKLYNFKVDILEYLDVHELNDSYIGFNSSGDFQLSSKDKVRYPVLFEKLGYKFLTGLTFNKVWHKIDTGENEQGHQIIFLKKEDKLIQIITQNESYLSDSDMWFENVDGKFTFPHIGRVYISSINGNGSYSREFEVYGEKNYDASIQELLKDISTTELTYLEYVIKNDDYYGYNYSAAIEFLEYIFTYFLVSTTRSGNEVTKKIIINDNTYQYFIYDGQEYGYFSKLK